MRITWSLFPKFLRNLTADELFHTVRDLGLDTTNLVIRDGYWVGRKTLHQDLPDFMRAARCAGLEIRFATAGFTVDEILNDSSLLSVLADHGIREFRMSYFPQSEDPRSALALAAKQLEQVATACARFSLRAVYQVHHGFLMSSASAAYFAVRDLPPEYVAIELDPGNQSFEGHENFTYSTRLLGSYFTAAGIKDTALFSDGVDPAGRPRSRRDWAPADQGTVDWFAFVRACKTVNFSGTYVLMPFYSENDPAEQIKRLRQEVSYLRRVVQIVEQE